jgi:hypothetical protein
MITLYVRCLDGKREATYEYVVMEDAVKIAEGPVKHRRKDGWAALVKRIAEQNEVKK